MQTAARTFALALLAAPLALRAQMAAHADSLYQARRFAEAAATYETLATSAPDSVRFWFRLGLSAAAQHDDARAAPAFARAASSGRNPFAVYGAGAAFARLRRPDTAFAYLRRVAALGIFSPDSLLHDADLAPLRVDPRFAVVVDSARASFEPCGANADARAFDFWVGEWRVQNAIGQPVGASSIQRVSGGCAILENWTGGTGAVGKSLNFYNHDTHQWQQYWVGQQGDQIQYTTSEWVGPTLRFQGVAMQRGGGRVARRLGFTPVARDTVRQFSEVSSDSGRTWATEYDFYYVRKPR